jgi:putative thioredoxin
MTQSPHIFEATPDNFATLVLENSNKGPVLVNYWAPWAGPCMKLWPVLEKLAGEFGGRFLLANLNTDKHKQLARDNGVNSLPTVRVYRHGKVAEEVRGAESESSMRDLINRHVARQSDLLLGRAVQAYQQGRKQEALQLIDQAAAAEPDNPRSAILLAKLLIRDGQYREAENALLYVPDDVRKSDEVTSLLAHAGVLRTAAESPPRDQLEQRLTATPDDLPLRYQLAAVCLTQDDIETSLDHLLEILRRDTRFADGAALRAANAIFMMLGREHSLTVTYRQRLQNLLN